MPSRRWEWTHTYAVPLFVTSLIAAIVAGAALVGVLVFSGGGQELAEDTDPTGPPSMTGSPAGGAPTGPPASEPDPGGGAGELDPCLLGVWRVVAHTESLLGLGALTQVGDGPTVEYRADGTATTDYGDGVQFESAGLLTASTMTVAGHLDYEYRVTDGRMRYSGIESQAHFSIDDDDGLLGGLIGDEFSYSEDPFTYHCTPDVLTFENPDRDYTAELHRAASGEH